MKSLETVLNPSNRFWAWLVLLFLGVAWGRSFSLAKMSTEGGAHPLGISYWQSLIGAVLLAAFNALKGRRLPLEQGLSFSLHHLWAAGFDYSRNFVFLCGIPCCCRGVSDYRCNRSTDDFH